MVEAQAPDPESVGCFTVLRLCADPTVMLHVIKGLASLSGRGNPGLRK